MWSSEEQKRLLMVLVRANAVAEDLYAETATSKSRPSIAKYYKERDEFVKWLMQEKQNAT